MTGLSLSDRMRSSVIREELGVEPLLLRIERSRVRWFSRLAWERLGTTLEELEKVVKEREVWASLLRLLPRQPIPDKQ